METFKFFILFYAIFTYIYHLGMATYVEFKDIDFISIVILLLSPITFPFSLGWKHAKSVWR